MARRRISKDDADLFRAAMKDAKPLPKRKRARDTRAEPVHDDVPQAPALDWDDAEDVSPTVSENFADMVDAPPPAKPKPVPAPERARDRQPLAPGKSGDLDKRTQRRLKRGKVEIYDRIDLHGMTQTVAHRALERFIAASQGNERRCVLVVTGKGLLKDGQGVLRQAVPRWLNEAPNRERVLSFSHAAPQDGGTGALYVLLRRAK